MKNTSTLVFCFIALLLAMQANAQKSSDDTSEESLRVYIPNAFTPNQDGANDVFKTVITGPEIELYELRIINRSGKEIFYSTDPKEVWVGDQDGDSYLSSPSLYVYFLRLKTAESIDIKTYKGHITVIR